MSITNDNDRGPTRIARRTFLEATSAVAVGAVAGLSVARGAHAAGSDRIRIGLIGCGGRGTGAAVNALTADTNTELVALGDAFENMLTQAHDALRKEEAVSDRIKVTPENCFVGLDAYERVIASDVDVVLLGTPPAFRPLHLAAAIKAKKHVFCEKPMATDAAGVRSLLESARLAKENGLSVVAGFNCRYEVAHQDFFNRVHDGALGEICALDERRLGGPVKPMQAASARKPEQGDLEWQLRNWYNFFWLSGDGLVEQGVHHVDRLMWAMRDVPPARCFASGGRNVGNHQGNIFDHMNVVYEWANGVHASMAFRQTPSCYDDATMYVAGTSGRGICTLVGNGPFIEGTTPWKFEGKRNLGYPEEHVALFTSVRNGTPVNDGVRMAQSTLAAIMARMSAYTGQAVSWETALNSPESLIPDNLSWDMKLPITPMAVPGITKLLVRS